MMLTPGRSWDDRVAPDGPAEEMTMRTIKIGDQHWHEESNGVWHAIPESAVSYGQILYLPSEAIREQIRDDLNAADECDLPADCRPESGSGWWTRYTEHAVSGRTPHTDAVQRRWGAELRAMCAYEDFRIASCDSACQ